MTAQFNSEVGWTQDFKFIAHLERVSIGEGLSAHLALHRPLRGVKLLNVKPEVSLAAAGGRAQLALEDGLVPGVDQPEATR